jgi:hypothetical protein
MNWAIVANSVVINYVVWDGVTQWEPPAGTALVHVNDGEICEIGWTYDDAATPRFAPIA